MPKFSSFNAFGSEANEIGQSHVPVWLGVVTPVPVGGVLAKAYALKGLLLSAGAPVKLAEKVITPFIGFEVVAYTGAGASDTYDTVVVKPVKLGDIEIAPAADDVLMKVGATLIAINNIGIVMPSRQFIVKDLCKWANYTNIIADDINRGNCSSFHNIQ